MAQGGTSNGLLLHSPFRIKLLQRVHGLQIPARVVQHRRLGRNIVLFVALLQQGVDVLAAQHLLSQHHLQQLLVLDRQRIKPLPLALDVLEIARFDFLIYLPAVQIRLGKARTRAGPVRRSKTVDGNMRGNQDRAATPKDVPTDFFDALRDDHALQAGAVLESTPPDFCDALRDDHALQVLAVLKGTIPDFLDALRNGHAGQIRAPTEGALPDYRDALRDGHAGQIRAPIEGVRRDYRDALRDGDAGHFLVLEGIAPDYRDALRDGHIPAGASVPVQTAVTNSKILVVFHDKYLLKIWIKSNFVLL